MQFRDLGAQYRVLKNEMNEAVLQVMEESNFINGRQVCEIEEQLAEYVGVKHCISCANGTDALTMALMAWNIKEGDAVFIPDFTFFASGEVVSFEGATPIFYDVCKETYNADVESLENAIKRVIEEGELRPRAIIAVDLFGLPADYNSLEELADNYGLLLLEDSAQGFGGKIGNRRAGSFGDIGTTSFFPAKPLGCYGDGGAIFTDDDKMAEYIRSIRVHGKGNHKYDNVRIGWNSRLDTLQAAILKVKFKAFKEYELEKVNIVAGQYTEALKDILILPVVPMKYYSSWAQYTVQLTNRDERDSLQNYLKKHGIPSMVYYPKPMHEQGAFHGVKVHVECGNTKQLCNTVLSLPMHPYLQREDIDFISERIIEFIRKNRAHRDE